MKPAKRQVVSSQFAWRKSRDLKARNGRGVKGGAMFNKLTRSLHLALPGRASSFNPS